MTRSCRFDGRLVRPPFPDRLCRAETMLFPLVTEDDFLSYAALPANPPGVPVLLSMAEKQALLLLLLEQAVALLRPLDRILIAARIPAGCRMPGRLLADDVFIVHDVGFELARLRAEGHSVLTITDGILRHPVEHGHNQVTLAWIGPDPDPAAWDGFTTSLEPWGIVRCTDATAP